MRSPWGGILSSEFAGAVVAVIEPRAGHALAEAALSDEVFFQPLDLAIGEIVRLVDEADGDVCERLGGTVCEEGAIAFEALAGALLPSAMFCLPERAACTIWSMMRSPRDRNCRQKRKAKS